MEDIKRHPVAYSIFALCCLLTVLGLFLYANSRDLADARLVRHVRKGDMVPNFSEHRKLLETLMSATERNLKLTQVLLVEEERAPTDITGLIAQTAQFFNPELTAEEADELAFLIVDIAEENRIDPLFMAAVISQESAFYETAESPVGAYGYGQLMPETAEILGVDPLVPEENLLGCARYLREHFITWDGHPDAEAYVLASYNAGPGAVATYGGVPPYEETQTYVFIILDRYATLLEAAEYRGFRKARLSF